MRLLLLTRDAIRHNALAQALATEHDLVVIRESASTPTPVDGSALQTYRQRVQEAERRVFQAFGQEARHYLQWMLHDLQLTTTAVDLAQYDRVIVSGTSWIKPPLLEALVVKGAVNLHAGIAPEYRGSGCNFWAQWDGHPELVGMTIHRLAAGLDSGDIIERIRIAEGADPWLRSMRVVRYGHERIVQMLRTMEQYGLDWPAAYAQPPKATIRYSRAADFTEAVAGEFLQRYTSAAVSGVS